MKILKDKEGNKLTFKEFMGKWKEGIDGITPLQKLGTQMTATRIQLLGIFFGLVVSGIAYKNLWWVGIILLGALINTVVMYLGLRQQRNNLLEHEEMCEEMTLDDLMNTTEEDLKKAEEEVMASEGGEICEMSEDVPDVEDYNTKELNKQEEKNGTR